MIMAEETKFWEADPPVETPFWSEDPTEEEAKTKAAQQQPPPEEQPSSLIASVKQGVLQSVQGFQTKALADTVESFPEERAPEVGVQMLHRAVQTGDFSRMIPQKQVKEERIERQAEAVAKTQ